VHIYYGGHITKSKTAGINHPHSVRFNQVAFSYPSGFGFSFGYCVLLCGWQCILLY